MKTFFAWWGMMPASGRRRRLCRPRVPHHWAGRPPARPILSCYPCPRNVSAMPSPAPCRGCAPAPCCWPDAPVHPSGRRPAGQSAAAGLLPAARAGMFKRRAHRRGLPLPLLLQLRRRTIWESDFLVLGCRTHRPGGSASAGPAGRAYHRCRPQCRAAGQRPVCGTAPPRWTACPCCWQSMIPSSTPSPRRCCPRKNAGKSCPGALVIDLASLPGGTDFDAAEALGIRAEHALALPGKCAPDTAGALIAQTVLTILQERGDLHDEPA